MELAEHKPLPTTKVGGRIRGGHPRRHRREILAEMRRLRHQLDKQRLLKTTAALKATE
jgi:hypothetical protein